MTSGKNNIADFINSEFFNPEEYDHADVNCTGQFKIEIQNDSIFNFDILGPVKLPVLPIVACPSCQSTYELEDYMKVTEYFISLLLLKSPKLLTKKQLKFLRILFDKSQAEIAELLRVDRSHYTKMESSKARVEMQPDQQVRVKIYYLYKLAEKIPIGKDLLADIVGDINQIDDSGLPVVDSVLLKDNLDPINSELLKKFS